MSDEQPHKLGSIFCWRPHHAEISIGLRSSKLLTASSLLILIVSPNMINSRSGFDYCTIMLCLSTSPSYRQQQKKHYKQYQLMVSYLCWWKFVTSVYTLGLKLSRISPLFCLWAHTPSGSAIEAFYVVKERGPTAIMRTIDNIIFVNVKLDLSDTFLLNLKSGTLCKMEWPGLQ